MARKEDSKADKQARLILDQLNTKTVGPPLATTGLTGDQAPDTIFTVDDFDKIRNQINLQLSNVEALNLLNTIGQITHTQSNGPIPNTQFCVATTDTAGTGSPSGDIYAPAYGTVWQIVALEWKTKNANAINFKIEDTTNDVTALIDYKTSTGEASLDEPVFVGYPCKLVYTIGTSTGNNEMRASLIRR